jgi:hypothetical protein
MVLTGGPALTADAPVLNLTQTWSNVAVTFKGAVLNVTDTTSAALSRLVEFQIGGVAKAGVVKDGAMFADLGIWKSAATSYNGANFHGFSFQTSSIDFYAPNFASNFPVRFGASSSIAAGFASSIGLTASTAATTPDAIISYKGTRNLQLGPADSATPGAQTLSVQSVVAGATTNPAGANFTINGSQGLGSGAGGSIIFQVAPAGTAANPAQNGLLPAFTINSDRSVTVAANASSLAQIAMADRGTVLSIYTTAFGTQPLLVSAPGGISIYNDTGFFRFGASGDVILSRKGIANLQLGAADAASATPQFLSVQSVVATTTDGAGADFKLTGSQSTGTGVPGNILIQTASSAAATGSLQNALATVATFGPSTLRLAQTTPALDLAQTWNTSGLASGLKINITDTASNVLSGAFEVQYGGSTYARIGKGASGYSMLWLYPGGTPTSANATIASGAGSTYFQASETNGFAFLGNANAAEFGVGNNIAKLGSGISFGFTNGSVTGTLDTILTRKGERNLQLGAADAATALAQTLSVQSVVANTTNGAGANFTINGSQGTGNAAGGSIIFQVAPAGGSGFAQNGLVNALTIASTNAITAGANGTISFPTSSTTLPSAPGIGAWVSTLGLFGSGGVLAATISSTALNLGSAYQFSWNSDTNFTRAAAGVVQVGTTASNASGTLKAAVLGTTTAYTVATLPTGFQGARAFVTDATLPTYLGALTGGGAVVCPVFYNGTAWVSA